MSYRSLRVGGLASGIDVESIIKEMVSAQKAKKTKLEQNRTLLEWKREDYRAINNQLRKLRDATSDLRLQGTFLKNTATSSDESKISVSANAVAVGSYTIEVQQLASSATLLGSEMEGEIDLTDSVYDLFHEDHPELVENETFTITINGKDLVFNTSDTLASVFQTINRDEDVGVVMFYDSESQKVVVTTKATGAESTETLRSIRDSDNAFFTALGLTVSDGETGVTNGESEEIAGTVLKYGSNAKLSINGLATERSSNTFAINGVTFNLHEVTDGPVTVGVQRDTDAILEKIKDWVEVYNNTLDAINSELNEERYSDYLPLTEEEMEELTDKQIDMWEEKARSGLLKRDSTLQSELYKIRNAVFGIVEGLDADTDFNHLSDIGIKVATATFDSDGKLLIDDDYMSGKLYIDEETLRNAIETNADKVMELFTKRSDVVEEKGIGTRLYAIVGESIDRITDIAGSDAALVDNSNIGERIRELNERIELEEERLERLEDRYWEQFTAMETAINQMNQQSAWLTMQFGMGNY